MSTARLGGAAARAGQLQAAGALLRPLSTTSLVQGAADTPRGDDEAHRPAAAAAAATAASRPSALVTSPPRSLLSLLHRTYDSVADTINRVIMLVASIQRTSAQDAYVASVLRRSVGLDSFTLEYLHVTRPALFRLSVARDIDPVVSWLKSLGIAGDALAELVRHTPAVLSASVDDQLEPLAAFIREMGGSPAQSLQAFPGLAVVPVAAAKGTRHVLRQLGVTEGDVAMLLLGLPDLYAQLALALQQLFSDFGVAGWKLAARQRRQLSGLVYHHMVHWNRPARRPASPVGAQHNQHQQQQQHGGESEEDEAAERPTPPPQPPGRRSHPHAHLHPHLQRLRGRRAGAGAGCVSRGHLLSTSYLLDREVYRSLVRVQAALEAVSLQPEGEEHEVVVSHLQHAIDALEELAGGSSGQEAREPQLSAAMG